MSGRHIKILGRGNPELLGSLSAVKGFLTDLVEEIGMRPLGEAQLYEVAQEIRKLGVEPFEDEGGVTGVIVLSTSHCAMHTWPLRVREDAREMFVLDIYSCRSFELDPVVRLLRLRFDANNAKTHDITRTLEYP